MASPTTDDPRRASRNWNVGRGLARIPIARLAVRPGAARVVRGVVAAAQDWNAMRGRRVEGRGPKAEGLRDQGRGKGGGTAHATECPRPSALGPRASGLARYRIAL